VNVASKTNEPISMQIGINLPPGQGHERSTSGVRRSKVKVTVTGGRTYVWKPGGDIILYSLSRVETKRHAVSNGNVAFERAAACCSPAFVHMRLANALVRGQISRQQ